MFKLGVSVLFTLGLVLTPLVAAAADFKVGVVDGMDVVSKSAEGKRLQESLKRKSEELGKPFVQRRQDFARQVEDFQKQASVMKEDAKKRKQEELQKKASELERQGADAEKQMAQFQEKELAPLLHKLETAVSAVAKDEKLNLVLDKRNSGLVYMDPSLDVTEKVRSKYGK